MLCFFRQIAQTSNAFLKQTSKHELRYRKLSQQKMMQLRSLIKKKANQMQFDQLTRANFRFHSLNLFKKLMCQDKSICRSFQKPFQDYIASFLILDLDGLQLILQKDYMGVCTSAPQRKIIRTLPLIFNDQTNKQKLNNTIQHEFQLDLTNVMIFSTTDKDLRIAFVVENVLNSQFDKQNALVTEMESNKTSDIKSPTLYQITWNQPSKVHFTSTLKELHEQTLTVIISNHNKDIEVVKINLYLIVYGPYHHNIELPFLTDFIRLLFDAKISNIFQANIQVKEFMLKTYQLPNLPQAHFSLKELVDQQVEAESCPSYNVQLPHSNQETGYFQEQRPNINRLKKNSSFGNLEESLMQKKLAWKSDKEQAMPALTVDISCQEIVHHSLQLLVWGSSQNDKVASYILESTIPLWKLLQKKPDNMNMKIESREGMRNIQIEERTIRLSQKLYCHHNVVGTCEIELHMKNQKMIQQMKYCTRTQDGIINLAPNAINNSLLAPLAKDIKSSNKTLHVLWKVINEIQEIINHHHDKYSMLVIHEKLTVINEKIIQSKNEIYTDANKVESLINSQNILLTFIEKLVPFIQNNQNPTFSSLSWEIIFNILEKNQFSLENLSLKGVYTTNEAKSNLARKKDVSKKYLKMLYSLIKYALKNYVLTSNLSQGFMNFLCIVFLRVKSFRDEFFSMTDVCMQDEEVEHKLTEYQSEVEPKTSFNEHFVKMKTDWEALFYKDLQDEADIKRIQDQLKGFLKNKKWFMQIGFKDELFYHFCCIFFDKLKQMSLGGSQKWKQVDGYSQLVIIILSEMKRKQVKDYSHWLIKTSLSMLGNEHLINLLMPLICQKTNIHDFQNVQVALDVFNQYLKVLTKNKTVPLATSFNQNFFFSIIRNVLEGEHFYSINRILIIIYDFFNLFGEHGRYQISMFLLGSSFFRLFYHWSKDIRNTFYNILLIRIQYIKHRKSSEILSKYNKALDLVGIIEKIYEKQVRGIPVTEQNLLKKLRGKIFQRRKKMPQSTSLCSKNQFQLQRLERIWQQQNDGSDYGIKTAKDLQNPRQGVRTDISSFRSEEFICTPQKKRRTYSQSIKIFQENEESSVKDSPARQQEFEMNSNPILKRCVSSNNPAENKSSDEKTRRKRKPSVFLNSISENPKHYTSTITNQLHCFTELTNEELKNILRAKVQFKEVKEDVIKHLAKYSTLPQRNFSQVNRKQMQG